ncbi:ArnT family glycosyltransferase [Nanoarchaeota archaeon]
MKGLDLVKKNWNWIVLILILILGFNLRAYHLDYPVVGYHNWKEVHYLTEARNFARDGFFDDGLFMPHSDIPYYDSNPNGIHKDTFPTISIIDGLFFKILGDQIWVARLINILFSLGSIFFFYLLIKKIFKREDLALTAATVLSILPLFVFFGRQTQLINPAIFFMLFGSYFYLVWIKKNLIRYSLLFSIGIMLATITKYSFALIIIPMLVIFPFKKIFKKENVKKYSKQMIIVILIILLIPTWMVYNSKISDQLDGYSDQGGFFGSSQINLLFKTEFWTPVKSFVADNYTYMGIILALMGIILLIFLRKKNKIGSKFFMGYVIGALIWIPIMASKLKGHSYHQYPLLPLIAFLISLTIVVISGSASSLINNKYKKFIKTGLIIIFLIIIFFPAKTAWQRQFDTQFIGLDVAGEYIKQNSEINDRVIHSRHQSFGVVWHADRKGENPPTNLSVLKKLEKRGANWIFMYQWGIPKITQNKEVWDYIQNNYGLEQIAFQVSGNEQQLIYLLLKKGGTFNETTIPEVIKDKPLNEKTYEFSRGHQKMHYINI